MRRHANHVKAKLSILAALAALSVHLGGCGGGAYPEPSTSSGFSASPSTSMYSGASSGVSELSVPSRGEARGELIVRPDALTIVFALRETKADAQQAIASLEAEVASMEKRLREATSNAASLRMCGVAIRRVAKGKTTDDGEALEATVVVDGSIEVSLAPELDYWKRSRLLAAIAGVTSSITESFKSAETDRSARFNEPAVSVKEPEAYRAKLAEMWVKRARAFRDTAQTAAAPLELVDCAVPAHIEQRVLSLEEVGLSLPVTCRLDVLRARVERAGAP